VILAERAPAAAYNDVGNTYDSDSTADKLEVHNERLRAACEDAH
jgi:hypothetical protein